MVQETIHRLSLYESKDVIPLGTYAPGVHLFRMNPTGNSILSTLYAQTVPVGASVSVRYWDFGPGSGETAGQQDTVAVHPAITSSDTSSKRLVTRCHNKIVIEATVVGSPVEFGLYTTVVADFPQDAPFLNGQVADLISDGAQLVAAYDEVQGKYFFLRIKSGKLLVDATGSSITAESSGVPVFKYSTVGLQTTPGTEQTLISETVPVGKIWKLRSTKVVCRMRGRFRVLVNGMRVDFGVTSPSEQNVVSNPIPYLSLTAGQTVELQYIQHEGSPAEIASYLALTEETV